MIFRRVILSFLIKISDFVGYSLGFILPLRSIDSIRSKKLKVRRNKKTVFLMENYGPLSRKRARSFEFKEPETLTWIESFDSDDSLIDIGANIGIYSIYAAKRGHRVIAFEPESQNFGLLNRHISLNNVDNFVEAFGICIFDKFLVSKLNISKGNELIEYGSSHHSFHTPTNEDGSEFNPIRRQGAVGITLDDFISMYGFTPNHIKIDVDGLEEKVLYGAKTILNNSELKSLLVELSPFNANYVDLVNFIKSCGFKKTFPEIPIDQIKNFIDTKRGNLTKNHIFVRY